jgi:hypothetical protein
MKSKHGRVSLLLRLSVANGDRADRVRWGREANGGSGSFRSVRTARSVGRQNRRRAHVGAQRIQLVLYKAGRALSKWRHVGFEHVQQRTDLERLGSGIAPTIPGWRA